MSSSISSRYLKDRTAANNMNDEQHSAASRGSNNDRKSALSGSLSNPPELKSTSVPYPSPPSSPSQVKAHLLLVSRSSGAKDLPHESVSPVTRLSSPPHSPGVSRVSGDNVRPTTAAAAADPTLSPPTHTSEVPNPVHEQKIADQIDVTPLRARLGLDTGLCGGRTLSGRPCRKTSPGSKLAQVTAQLELMANFTQSSKELKPALEKLVMLVHCDYHDRGDPKQARIRAWKDTFPAGEALDTANAAASIEEHIREAVSLEPSSTQCLAIAASTGNRCRHRIGGQQVQHCLRTVNEIVKPETYLNDSLLDGFLRVLETNMYCYAHQNREPLKKVAAWKSTIIEIRGEQLAESIASRGPDETSTRLASSPSPDFSGDLSKFWPAEYDISPFEISKKSDRLADYQSSYPLVGKEIIRELESDDLKSGHVYVYEVKGNKGFVKIGYTTRALKDRHKEWEFDCNRVPIAIYPLPSSAIANVPNARRVEALCHMELDHRRIKIECEACRKPHLEWFEVSAAEAIAVVQKWSRWMATGPYRSIKLRYVEKWTLKEDERRRTWNMKRFMEELSEPVAEDLQLEQGSLS